MKKSVAWNTPIRVTNAGVDLADYRSGLFSSQAAADDDIQVAPGFPFFQYDPAGLEFERPGLAQKIFDRPDGYGLKELGIL